MAVMVPCSTAGGRLIPIEANMVQPITIALSYQGVPLQLTQLGAATKIEMTMQVAAQFQPALTNVIYVTPFGDQPGEIRLNFVANRKCDEVQSSLEVIQTYLDRRLQPGSNVRPATVAVGPGQFLAYLVGLAINAESSNVQMVQGTLFFRAWPQ